MKPDWKINMADKIRLSIVVCTRNRDFILPECLDSLIEQSLPSTIFEVIIVDNASTDKTAEIAKKYTKKYRHFQYSEELEIGLSKARNCGYLNANSQWIIYLDDDARASENFVERAIWVIDHFDFDLFGGMYYAWFKYGRPRWLPENYGNKQKLLDEIGNLEEGFASGGIMAVKKRVIEDLGGFAPHIGMKKSLGYGEEDEFQIRLRKKGYQIGFDPEWRIDHCILPAKLKLAWHFNAAFAQGRDQAIVFQRYSSRIIIYGFIRSLFGMFWKIPSVFRKWIFKKDFYWQNVLWDLFIPITFQIGRIKGWFVRKYAN